MAARALTVIITPIAVLKHHLALGNLEDFGGFLTRKGFAAMWPLTGPRCYIGIQRVQGLTTGRSSELRASRCWVSKKQEMQNIF